MLRGMHHKRIKYHNELVQELDKNRQINNDKEEDDEEKITSTAVISKVLDSDLESKIKELESKRNDSN